MPNDGQSFLVTQDATQAEIFRAYTAEKPVQVNLSGTTVDQELEEILIDLHQKHGLRLAQILRTL